MLNSEPPNRRRSNSDDDDGGSDNEAATQVVAASVKSSENFNIELLPTLPFFSPLVWNSLVNTAPDPLWMMGVILHRL